MTLEILIYGNPSDGFTHVGPFESAEHAAEYADCVKNIRDDSWWSVTLQAPDAEILKDLRS